MKPLFDCLDPERLSESHKTDLLRTIQSILFPPSRNRNTAQPASAAQKIEDLLKEYGLSPRQRIEK